MHWVLQNNIFREEGFKRLLETLQRFGISHTLHKVIPFIGVISPPLEFGEDYIFPDEFDENYEPPLPDGPKIVMGSYSMAFYAQRKGWRPGSFANENHDFRVQVKHWGEAMLNHDAQVMPFSDVPKTRELFFIRPVEDTKSFAGHVTGWGKYKEWRDKVMTLGADNGGTLEGSTLVMVSPVRKIFREYRLWVVDGYIVTASLYKEGSTVRYSDQVDKAVLDWALPFTGHPMLYGNWAPARAYVLDVFETEEGYKIGEVNCINSAGFYAADMQKLVDALNHDYLARDI